ncbi:unnamed protein product, partial [Onchocerca flexuosa]
NNAPHTTRYQVLFILFSPNIWNKLAPETKWNTVLPVNSGVFFEFRKVINGVEIRPFSFIIHRLKMELVNSMLYKRSPENRRLFIALSNILGILLYWLRNVLLDLLGFLYKGNFQHEGPVEGRN